MVVLPFDEEFYQKMNHTYIGCLPVSIHMKYGLNNCYDKSLYMFFCFKNAVLVRGDNKDLEYRYGKKMQVIVGLKWMGIAMIQPYYLDLKKKLIMKYINLIMFLKLL